MTVTYLADSASAVAMAARIIGGLLFPVLGVTLLVIGLRSRWTARRQSSTGYPPGYPPGFPPGTPGYPGPQYSGFGYPAGVYPPYPTMSPPPRKAGTGLIVTGIVLLVLGAVGIVGVIAVGVGGRSSRLAIGDCFTNEILDKSRWKPASCNNPDAVLEYAANTDSAGNCPDGKLSNSSYLSIERDGARRCFLPNLLERHCYASERNDESVRQVSCGSVGRVVRLVKRLDGTIDTSVCPANSRTVTFPRPKRTYCTERTGMI
jgi:hypothetical protein